MGTRTPARTRSGQHRGRHARALLAAAALGLLGGVAACDGGGDSGSASGAVLPPGMTPPPQSNADLAPPAVPFDAATPRWRARVVAGWPHDVQAYTQGLLVDGGRLYESTGLEGASSLRRVELRTGRVLQRHTLAARYFGEGIAMHGGRLYMLTWRAGKGWIFDPATLAPVDSFTYAGEGWGLAGDGARLYLSDGSARVSVIDPAGFTVERTFEVTEAGRPVHSLNELEWMDGELLANIYNTSLIARIDPASGQVRGWIDVAGLLSAEERAAVERVGGVANGIAWDAERKRLLVTGKMWPRLFEVELEKQ